MGLFGDAAQQSKAKAQARAEAATQKRVDKLNAKAQETLPQHGLDFDHYTDEELKEVNQRAVLDVDNALAGTNVYQLGALMSGGGANAMLMALLKAQVHQNWILVRQNEQILRELKKLNRQ